MTPLNVVLLQEVSRYNNLLQLIRKSLSDLENGIKGIVLMSPELEETYANIYEGKVPHSWNKAYLSLKPLASWTRDLGMRIEFFNEWSKGYLYFKFLISYNIIFAELNRNATGSEHFPSQPDSSLLFSKKLLGKIISLLMYYLGNLVFYSLKTNVYYRRHQRKVFM